METELVINAPCKINLHLDVGQKRPDGFHAIDSLFVALNLCDTLTFRASCPSLKSEGAFAVTMDARSLPDDMAAPLCADALPPEKNLVWQAASLFNESYPLPFPVEIAVTKRIPAGAGLGGASSDGAAVLAGLNQLFGEPCPPRVLGGMAARLGSDVPFFLRAREALAGGKSASFWARARGRGDIIESAAPVMRSPFWALLAYPGFFSGTAKAYALLDGYRARKNAGDAGAAPETRGGGVFFNHFLPVLLEEGAAEEGRRLRALLDDLNKRRPVFAGLSGSGSVCFALFAEYGAAEAAREALAALWPWCVLAGG